MAGVSYLAMAQFKAAALRPPSLKAICPWEGFTDAYRDMFNPGGVAEKGFSRVWQTGTKHVMRVTEDIGAQRRVHPLRDQWWQSLVPDLGRIEVPMLVCASFSDNNLHGRGSFRAFEKVGAEDKFAYTHRGGKWTTFYSPEARQAQLAFFDRYLKHLDVPKPPRVRLEVRERGDVIAETRAERQWPLVNTYWRDLYLADDGVLDHELGSRGIGHLPHSQARSGIHPSRGGSSRAHRSDEFGAVGVSRGRRRCRVVCRR